MHNERCECMDCRVYRQGFTLPETNYDRYTRARWLDTMEATLAVIVFFLIGFLLGCAL